MKVSIQIRQSPRPRQPSKPIFVLKSILFDDIHRHHHISGRYEKTIVNQEKRILEKAIQGDTFAVVTYFIRKLAIYFQHAVYLNVVYSFEDSEVTVSQDIDKHNYDCCQVDQEVVGEIVLDDVFVGS
jgi:hypothetical protein